MNTWVKKLPGVAITLAFAIALAPVVPAYAYALSAATGSVTGSVKAAHTGLALANVTVRVFDMDTAEFVAEAVTNDEGVLDLSDLPFGLYQVTVVPPEGYASAAGPLVHLSEENAEATVGFNLEPLPNAPAAAFVGGWPLWAILAALFGAAAVGAGIYYGVKDDTVGTG